ncbi:hypothetical protein [Haloplanus halobius]|uniref:hypothetical protein n=1 Tax=Haloplanus halobius TaxID=2934938 RepID=UPI00200C1CAD|nr:hypothetical protein [Haloplanus sp. XH21]
MSRPPADERRHWLSLRRAYRWLLLDGDRVVVAGVALAVGFALVGVAGHTISATLVGESSHQHTTVPLVGALLSGNFLLFSIVVSVNSLFVTQEESALDREFGRIQSIVEFRRQLEDVLDVEHVPAAPVRFVRLLSAEILSLAQAIDDDVHAAEFELRADLDEYLDSLAEETGEMNRRLRVSSTNADIVIAMMDYNHDRQINDLRRLRSAHSDNLPSRTEESITELLQLLQYFATARSYFKSLYIRQEFANLSRNLVFTSVLSVATTASFMHFLGAIPTTHLLVATVEAIALAPFVLVGSYVLRVSAVSRRTQAAGQFVVSDSATGDIEGISPPERGE